jgi:glycosyltransferase involved in cell wall biosynthesis
VKRVLIITYYWPPSGGAGVQRWLKLSGYLPHYGIDPVVITVDPEYATYPVSDPSLEKEIPRELPVYKTRATDYFRMLSRDKTSLPTAGFAKTGGNPFKEKIARFVRGNFFIPDPRKGWNKYAFRKACELIESLNITTVITTSPPHSSQLIGLKLKKRYPGLRWIADLRDPWTDIYYYNEFFPTLPARCLDKQYEKKVITGADALISVGKGLTELFARRYPAAAKKFTVIQNGYDPVDFDGLAPTEPERFNITYVGTVSTSYNIVGLTRALAALNNGGHDFCLRFTGFVAEKQKESLIDILPTEKLSFAEYCSHHEAVKEMLRASVLLLLIPDHESSKVILTGKLFEYIATGKPILCIGPVNGDAALLVSSLANGMSANYDDTSAITSFLERVKNKKTEDREYLNPGFSRKEGAKILAAIV